jgi:hypothetical protein
MEKYKKYLHDIAVFLTASFGAYASYTIYNYQNPLARAILGLLVIYLLYKIFRTPIKIINWLYLDSTFKLSAFIRNIGSTLFICIAVGLAFHSIVNLIIFIYNNFR